MTKVKLVIALVVVVLMTIVIYQNLEPMEARLLFTTIAMPRAALLGITLLIGIAAGVALTLVISARRRRSEPTEPTEPEETTQS
ncbi:LapA family protein [Desulfatitalea alkaliphila]|uniref:LapA family protein n=1 Tax=Desulfatitalea alkaliphila TaxID=2929485 RepID=A0AA41R378_9BACT|nr:LapA family protein [Desulfatitalea alkaliphila]MCJ8500901.1 LapA family protein [Desulfatitalea alkaliphila]